MHWHRLKARFSDRLTRSARRQINAWRKANRKIGHPIDSEAFESIGPPPLLNAAERAAGFREVVLCYGFGDDGAGHSDSVLSAKAGWKMAQHAHRHTWQCRYIDFDHADHMRLRPGAVARPMGFYWVKWRPGNRHRKDTVTWLRRHLASSETGCGAEGVQMLAITHRHLARQMNQRQMNFMALADLDVAPYGYGDFFDAVQMFCSNDTLGMGIGHVDRVYPLFGIPVIRLVPRGKHSGT